MIFITGPLYSGKRTFARTLPGRVHCRRAGAGRRVPPTCLNLADKLSAYDIVLPPRWAAVWCP